MDIEKQTIPPPSKPLLPIWGSIPLYIIASFLLIAILGAAVLLIMQFIPESESVYYKIGKEFAFSSASLAGVWITAAIFLKKVDCQPVSELGMGIKGRWKDCLAGLLFAIVLYAIGFTASLALGAFEFTFVGWDFGILFGTFCFYFVAASMEEVMVRGYIQGRLMTKMNKFLAMCIASLIFSALHIANDNITFFALVNLFLAGLLLGASYMYTRNLWFPIFLHTAWNWIQGPILGYEVSGTKMFPSVINLHLPEENIINGGRFGFEGSIICTILMIIGTALIITWYRRGGSRTAQA